MSQPPYQPHPGESGPEPGEGHQPPAAPGAYPPPSYPPAGQDSFPPSYPPASYPPPDQGGSPPPGYGAPGTYPPPGQDAYPPPDQAGSPPPGSYPPPGYGAPGTYPPPGQGAYPPPGGDGFPPPGGGAPMYGAPPAKKKSSALKIVLIVVGVVALLCIGGGVAVFFAAKDKVEDVVDAAKITVVEPETLGGRPKATDPTLQSSVSSLDAEMSKLSGTTATVGAIYGDPAQQDFVMVAAASTLSGTAEGRFEELTKGLSQGVVTVNNLTDTDPGPLGGIAKCGDSETSGVSMAVCFWSDNGSVGMIAMLFKKKADLEKEFVSLRGEIEQKA